MTQKIKFRNEKQRYTVQAFDARFAIMTKPFNARKTYLYTVTDLRRGFRSHFGCWGPPGDVDTPEGAQKVLDGLNNDEHQLLHKNSVDLHPCEIEQLNGLAK